ncbi:hypothetical protein GIB67_012486 [Kingdonia uniflora]|uniref:Cupin-like domain-containing protein n=1 Tax=Kingdonia uniflora TaxID=39325 RepID=A0A7J7MVC1_9MAGN|nr:hypothetical protein GIB67_012486 [Kingdonia uniflora]
MESGGVEKLWSEVREVSLGRSTSIERLDRPPSPLQFLRDFVSPNKPFIISNTNLHWPALTKWNPNYLSQALSQTTVSLHLSPNGRADSVVTLGDGGLCFASAHVQRMLFNDALKMVEEEGVVAYLQEQNDCFRSEYGLVSDDVDGDIQWATSALGCLPDAVNLWIGNQRSETSFHKDHYENLYAVVSGNICFFAF